MKRFWRREEVEDFAMVTLLDFRRRTGLPLAPPIDIDLVGEIGCGLQWDWDILPEPPSTRVWAALFPPEARVVLNEVHAQTFAASHGLERFTKAHEIGHWMLHVDKDKGEYTREFVTEYIVRGSLATPRTRAGETNWLERHADWFAAALLMPASLFVPAAEQSDLSSARGVSTLAGTFGVSVTAARVRLSQFGFAAG